MSSGEGAVNSSRRLIHRYLDGRPYLRGQERLFYFIIAVIVFALSLWGLLAPA